MRGYALVPNKSLFLWVWSQKYFIVGNNVLANMLCDVITMQIFPSITGLN